jgi:hypothetical protein
MPALEKFAWLLHANDEGIYGKEWQVAVNWVMPWGATVAGTKWTDGVDMTGMTSKAVIDTVGSLVWPWALNITAWYGIPATAPWNPVALDEKSLDTPADREQIQARIQKEIVETTRDCPQPFSLDPRYLHAREKVDAAAVRAGTSKGSVSLAHAFAPLTHLPAAISGDVLGVTRGFRCEAGNRTLYVACVPEFTVDINGVTRYFQPHTVEEMAAGIFSVAYKITLEDDQPGGLPFTFSVITQRINLFNGMALTASLHKAERADTRTRALLLADAFSPLRTVGLAWGEYAQALLQQRAVNPATPIPSTTASFFDLLFYLLGDGLLRKEEVRLPTGSSETRWVGIWERLPRGTSARSEQATLFYTRLSNHEAVLNELLVELAKPEAKTQMRELLEVLKPFLIALDEQDLGSPNPFPRPNESMLSASPRHALSELLRLAGSSDAKHLWAAWFAAVATLQTKAHSDEFWSGSYAEWYRMLAAVLDPQTIAFLQMNAWLTYLDRLLSNLPSSKSRARRRMWFDAVHAGVTTQWVTRPEDVAHWTDNPEIRTRGITDAAVATKAAWSYIRRAYAWGAAALLDVRTASTIQNRPLLRAFQRSSVSRLQSWPDVLLASQPATVEESLGEDRDLAVTVYLAAREVNRELRGYAVAIAAGYEQPEPNLNAEWITDVACRVRKGKNDWELLCKPDKITCSRFHDTVGTTKVDGHDVIAFPYAGNPINGWLKSVEGGEDDPDGVATLDFYLPESGAGIWKLPKLAYGLGYWVCATPVGNAGRIIDEEFADKPGGRKLIEAAEAFDFKKPAVKDPGPAINYLCRVAPGQPVIKVADPNAESVFYELMDESRTRVFLALNNRWENQRIGLIRPVERAQGGDGARGWIKGSTSVTLIIRGPDATPNVIERWLQADWSAKATGKDHRCDDLTREKSKEKIADLQADYRALLKPRKKAEKAVPAARTADRFPRHPAMRDFGVEVEFYDAFGRQVPNVVPRRILNATVSADEGYIKDCSLEVTHGSACAMDVQNGRAKVTLAPACFVEVKVYALVPEAFFSGPETTRMANLKEMDRWEGGKFRAFTPAHHWFECLPEPLAPASRIVESNKLLNGIRERVALQALKREVLTGIASESTGLGYDATWLKGFYIERHEWHWTGYPQAFPRPMTGTPTLADWAGPFIGTESLRDTKVCCLRDELDRSAGWRFALKESEVLTRYPLQAEYGAKYVVSLLRPIRRFDSWLARWSEFDSALLGAGTLVPAQVRWSDPGLRLAPPVVRAAIPLVRTFRETGPASQAATQISANGNLVVLDDVLYRTDVHARFGGVGEIIEVDLEETRFNEVFEIGANPSVHAGPSATVVGSSKAGGAGKHKLPIIERIDLPYPSVYRRYPHQAAEADAQPVRRMNWRIEADPPFGLTYDLDRNAKVAQTAIIVRPTGTDAFSYWIMAKVRLRRLLDPDAAWTSTPPLQHNDNAWLLGRRREGDDYVPHDFCVEISVGTTIAGLATSLGLSLVFEPAFQAQGRTRLLCTWHKGHWSNTSDMFWGLQVYLQELRADSRQWITVAKYSPYEMRQPDEGIATKKDEVVRLMALPTVPDMNKRISVRRLLASDYSESHWLTFIGMPFRNLSFANESYWVSPGNDELTLFRSNSVVGTTMEKPQGEQVSYDLLLNPMKLEHFDGAAEALKANSSWERIGAERNAFHVLLVFEKINDVATPAQGFPLGRMVGAFTPVRGRPTETVLHPAIRFQPLTQKDRTPISKLDPKRHVGYIYRFHCVQDEVFTKEDLQSWEDLVMFMFPEVGGAEAKIRWTPEFIGPVHIAKDWPDQVPIPKPMEGTKIRIFSKDLKNYAEVHLDPELGWRLGGTKGNISLFNDGSNQGVCRVNEFETDLAKETLELHRAGGRIAACLVGWPERDGERVIAFDQNGEEQNDSFIWKKI